MTIFRAEPALALAAALFSSAAFAQTGPVPTTPLPKVEAPPPPQVAPRAAIEVDSLGTTDGPPTGLLDTSNGGLGDDIWAGSSRADIEDRLARLPLATPVRSVHMLARRLVLTTAEAPTGQAPRSFQTVRITALMNAGLVGDAAKLAAQIHLNDDAELIRVQAEALLFGGTSEQVCSDTTKLRETAIEPFWMQLRAYCFGASGQDDLLDLTRGVMKAEGADDKAFETLLDDVFLHKTTPPGEFHQGTAVGLFLLKEAGLPISPVFSARFGMAASVIAFRAAKNPPSARADAAAQVLHSGALPAGELDAVADVQTFTPQQLANADAASVGLPFFLGQALIRQAVARAPDDQEKAKLLAVAFRIGRQMQLLPVAAEMQRKALASIIPGATLRAYAPTFSRALLLAHEADAAERWRELLDPKNDADGSLAAGIAVTLNLVATNPGRAARARDGLAWLAHGATSPQAPNTQEIGVMALALYDALGEPMPAGLQLQPLLAKGWPGRVIPPATRKHIAELTGQPGRKGEVVLAVLDAIGAGGPGDLTPEAAAFLVRTLKAEGESDAARAVAADTLLLFEP